MSDDTPPVYCLLNDQISPTQILPVSKELVDHLCEGAFHQYTPGQIETLWRQIADHDINSSRYPSYEWGMISETQYRHTVSQICETAKVDLIQRQEFLRPIANLIANSLYSNLARRYAELSEDNATQLGEQAQNSSLSVAEQVNMNLIGLLQGFPPPDSPKKRATQVREEFRDLTNTSLSQETFNNNERFDSWYFINCETVAALPCFNSSPEGIRTTVQNHMEKLRRYFNNVPTEDEYEILPLIGLHQFKATQRDHPTSPDKPGKSP